jgi:hypothetical protein
MVAEESAMPRELVGPWEELIKREDLRGHRVRVIVEDPELTPDADAWVKGLYEMAGLGIRTDHVVDTSRDCIYSGRHDDPR